MLLHQVRVACYNERGISDVLHFIYYYELHRSLQGIKSVIG
jgi:hypothetical protein